jgi:predicted HTH transcriptional regulator
MRDLYERLTKGGATEVRALLGRQEQVDFDCNRKAEPSHPSFETADKQNLGRALSALCNSMGGLLLWGVDARKNAAGFDVVVGFMRIPTKPAMHSNRKPATCSDLKPAGIPI